MIEGSNVADDVGGKAQLAPRGQHGNAVVAHRPGENDHVARLGQRPADFAVVADDAHTGGVDVEAVGFAALDDFRVPGDDLHPRLGRRDLHRFHHPRQHGHVEPFLQNESGGQIEGRRPHHRQIVHRTADRQPADVAAGKEQGGHDMGIGADGQTARRNGHHPRIIGGAQGGIIERSLEEATDQIVAHPAAAAVTKDDLFVMP